MVKRVEYGESKEKREIYQKVKSLSSIHCRIFMLLIPKLEDKFPRYNLGYMSTVIGLHIDYLQEFLDFLVNKDLVSFDGDEYYLTVDNIWKLEDVVKIQPSVLLLHKLDSLEHGERC